MTFSAQEVIEKTRDKKALSREEITALIESYVAGKVADYQISAWLMAVCLNGLSRDETVWLTEAMRDSGARVPRNLGDTRYWIDKHSTGGVGDKTSLILVPLVSVVCEKLFGANRVCIPMVSGRGLGHTGGTLDKLESVPGFSSKLSLERAAVALGENSFFMMGQTSELVPADRKMYALRDCTGTVESIPLIVASILSKKLAENLDGLVIDLKWGSGAFMPTDEAGRALGKRLVSVAREAGVNAVALLSRMEEPLGYACGHALEVEECYDFVCGTRRESGMDTVVLALASQMVSLASRGKIHLSQARTACEDAIGTESVRDRFLKMFTAQGGDWSGFLQHRQAVKAQLRCYQFSAPGTGWLSRIDARTIARLLWKLGAGRRRVDDAVDLDVGIELHKKVGDSVTEGEPILSVFYKESAEPSDFSAVLRPGIDVSESKLPFPKWVSEVIDE